MQLQSMFILSFKMLLKNFKQGRAPEPSYISKSKAFGTVSTSPSQTVNRPALVKVQLEKRQVGSQPTR